MPNKSRTVASHSGPALANQRQPLALARKRKSQWRRWFWGYFFIGPSLLLFILFSIYPLLSAIVLSFQRVDLLEGRSWVGLENYSAFLHDKAFHEVLRVTFTYFLGIVPVGTILTLLLSVLIFGLPSKLGNSFKAAFYLPSIASAVVLSLVWLYLFNPVFGVLNYILESLGLAPVLWLAGAKTALWSLVFMYHATSWGGSVVLVCAALGGIPAPLYEAATIDGASRFQQFLRITLPLLRPVLTYVVIMSTISSLRIFNQIYLMTAGGPGTATTNLVFHVYTTAFLNLKFGPASARIMLLLVVTMVLAVVQYRYLATDVEY